MSLIVTLYTTAVQAVRKTADDCRRMTALMDALGVVYENVAVDTVEMKHFVEELTGKKTLPLCCVGETCIGTFEEVMDFVEDSALPRALRDAGYTESIRGGENISVKPPPLIKKTIVKKVVVVKKSKSEGATAASSNENVPDSSEQGNDWDDDVPPPPPQSSDEVPPPPPEDDVPPPPPPDDDDAPPPPPPEDDAPPPPPPPEDDDPPPPPEN